MKIFNSARNVTNLQQFERIYDIPFDDMIPAGTWTPATLDFAAATPESIKAALEWVPSGAKAVLDVEGNPDPKYNDVNLHLLDYNGEPATAIALRAAYLNYAKAVRPDIELALYGWPWQTKNYQDGEYDAINYREMWATEFTQNQDFLLLSCYPTSYGQAEWEKRTRTKIGLAQIWHPGKEIIVQITRKDDSWQDFKAKMQFLEESGADAVSYWDKQSVTEVAWDTGFVLWTHSQ